MIALAILIGIGSVAAIASQEPAPSRRASLHVHIAGFSFSPSPAQITQGDDVVWHNHDVSTHTSTSDSSIWDTGFLSNGEVSAAVTFGTVGTFPYHCNVHPGMLGTVEVQASGSEFSGAAILPALALGMAVCLLLLRRAGEGRSEDL